MANAVDQVARDNAAKAIALVEAHERVCIERSRESETWRALITSKLDEYFSTVDTRLLGLTGEVEKIYSHMWIATGMIISTLLGIIGYLTSKVL